MSSGANLNQAKILSILFSVVFYGVIVSVNFCDDVHATQVKAFGAAPFGLPVGLVVSIVETILYIPAPFFISHLAQMAIHARKAGRRFGIVYILTAGYSDPTLRRSWAITLAGLGYFIIVCFSWITYASWRGL